MSVLRKGKPERIVIIGSKEVTGRLSGDGGEVMIEIKNLSKSFRTSAGTVEALKNISLTVNDGDIYGIIGMSGAGKSTLVRCINKHPKKMSFSL